MKFSIAVIVAFLATASAAPIPWNPEGYDLTPVDVPGYVNDGVSPPGDAPVAIVADSPCAA